MASLGKLLVAAGAALALAGAGLLLAGRLGVPPGRLPGDIVYRGRNTTIYFPWVTMLLLSAALTLVANWLWRR